MTKLLNLLPLIGFFLFFFISDKDFMVATAALMGGAVLQIICYLIFSLKISKSVLYSTIAILVLGALTLALNDSLFVKIKPSVVLLVFAGLFAYEAKFAKAKNLNSLLFQNKLDSANEISLNLILFAWICCIGFTSISIINIVLLQILSDEQWVYFKLFGIPASTAVSLIIAFLLAAIYTNKQVDEVLPTNDT